MLFHRSIIDNHSADSTKTAPNTTRITSLAKEYVAKIVSIDDRNAPISDSSLNLRQNLHLLAVSAGLNLFVIDLNAIVQVDFDTRQGDVSQFRIVVLGFFQLLLELVLALGCLETSRESLLLSMVSCIRMISRS